MGLTGLSGLSGLSGVAGGTSFVDPSSIPGLKLWLKGDAGTFQDSARTTPAAADGDVVGGWADQSGQGFHVGQATAANKPLLKTGANGLNGLPVVRSDGSNDHFYGVVAATPTLVAFTYVVVYRRTNVGTNGIFLNIGANSGGRELDITGASNKFRLLKANVALVATSTAATTTAPGIETLTWDGVSVAAFYANGAADGGATAATTFTNGTTHIAISTDPPNPGTISFAGDFAEILAYDSALSAAQRSSLHAYLGAKWGIAVT